MLHKEVDGKYGLFLLDYVFSPKDENQITCLDLQGSPRSMISGPGNILYRDRIGADLVGNVALYPFPTAQKVQVWHVSGQTRSSCPLRVPDKQNQRVLKLQRAVLVPVSRSYSLSFSSLFLPWKMDVLFGSWLGSANSKSSEGHEREIQPFLQGGHLALTVPCDGAAAHLTVALATRLPSVL